MAKTKIHNLHHSQIASDVNMKTVTGNAVFPPDATPNIVDNSETACVPHPLASLLGTFTGDTWEEIRQEIAREHQQEDIAASQS